MSVLPLLASVLLGVLGTLGFQHTRTWWSRRRRAKRDFRNLSLLCGRRCGMPGPSNLCFQRLEKNGIHVTPVSGCKFVTRPDWELLLASPIGKPQLERLLRSVKSVFPWSGL
jgi:hypothetical protein